MSEERKDALDDVSAAVEQNEVEKLPMTQPGMLWYIVQVHSGYEKRVKTQLEESIELCVPGCDEARHLLIIKSALH